MEQLSETLGRLNYVYFFAVLAWYVNGVARVRGVYQGVLIYLGRRDPGQDNAGVSRQPESAAEGTPRLVLRIAEFRGTCRAGGR